MVSDRLNMPGSQKFLQNFHWKVLPNFLRMSDGVNGTTPFSKISYSRLKNKCEGNVLIPCWKSRIIHLCWFLNFNRRNCHTQFCDYSFERWPVMTTTEWLHDAALCCQLQLPVHGFHKCRWWPEANVHLFQVFNQSRNSVLKNYSSCLKLKFFNMKSRGKRSLSEIHK